MAGVYYYYYYLCYISVYTHSVTFLSEAIWLVGYLGVGVIAWALFTPWGFNYGWSSEKKTCILNWIWIVFFVQNFMLRLSVVEITLWVCTKTIFIVILLSLCEEWQNFNLDLRGEKTIIVTLYCGDQYWKRDLLQLQDNSK